MVRLEYKNHMVPIKQLHKMLSLQVLLLVFGTEAQLIFISGQTYIDFFNR